MEVLDDRLSLLVCDGFFGGFGFVASLGLFVDLLSFFHESTMRL